MNKLDFENGLKLQSCSYSPIRHLSEQVSWKPQQPNHTPVIPNKRNKLYTFNNFNSLSITDKQENSSPASPIQSASKRESEFSLSMSKCMGSLQRKYTNGTPLKLKQTSPIAKRVPIQISNKQNFMSFGNNADQSLQHFHGAGKECVVVSQQELLQFTHKFAEDKVKSQEQISYLKIVISDLLQQIKMLKLENADLYECLQYKSKRQQQLESYLKYSEQYCSGNHLDKLPQTQKTTMHSRQHSHRYNCTKSEKSSYPSIIEQFHFMNNDNVFPNQTSNSSDCELFTELQEENRNLRARVEFLEITLEHLETQKQLSEEILRDYECRQSKLSDNEVFNANSQMQEQNLSLQLLIKQKNIEIEIYQKALEDCAKLIAQSKQQQKCSFKDATSLSTFTEKDLKNVVFRMMVPILEMEQYK